MTGINITTIPPAENIVEGESAIGTIAGSVVGALIGVILVTNIIVILAILVQLRLRSDNHTLNG